MNATDVRLGPFLVPCRSGAVVSRFERDGRLVVIAGDSFGVVTMLLDEGSGQPVEVLRRGSNAVARLAAGTAQVLDAGPARMTYLAHCYVARVIHTATAGQVFDTSILVGSADSAVLVVQVDRPTDGTTTSVDPAIIEFFDRIRLLDSDLPSP